MAKIVIERHRGTTIEMQLSVTTAAGAPYDLTGKTITFKASVPGNGVAVITKTGVIVSAVGGTCTITLVPTDTQNLTGDLDFVVTVTSGSDTYAVVNGTLRLRGNPQ